MSEVTTPSLRVPCVRLSTLLLAAALCGSAQARDEARPLAAAVADAIESCVDTATIRFATGDRHALLDEADADAVGTAILTRYPMVSQDGFEPSGLVLWQKPDAGWVYIALLANPSKPSQVCFTATFAAGRFGITAALLQKYFGISAT